MSETSNSRKTIGVNDLPPRRWLSPRTIDPRVVGRLAFALLNLVAIGLPLIFGLARAESLQEAYPTIRVTEYGAKCDRKTDDTAALRAAAMAVPSNGATLKFPKGTCLISGTIYVKSHTHLEGGATYKDDGTPVPAAVLKATVPFHIDYPSGGALLENEHYKATTLTDTDISVNGMSFEYGMFGHTQPLARGGKHAVRFRFVDGVSVTHSVFHVDGAEDAVAGLGVRNMLVRGNYADGFGNCAYDFWTGPTNVKLIDNYAKTERSSQIVNFNPDATHQDESKGLIASGLTMSGNVLIATGPKAPANIISPLGPGTAVQNVVITNNRLTNTYLILRGQVSNAVVSHNSISDLAAGPPAIAAYPWPLSPALPMRGNAISFSDNTIVNPSTSRGEVAVIRLNADNSSVTGNTTIGGSYDAAPFFVHGAGNEMKLNITKRKAD